MSTATRQPGNLGLVLELPEDRPKLWWHRYVDPITTPIPAVFGHYDKISSWGMLANDQYGCCAWASSAHEVMVQNAAQNPARIVTFTDANVLSDYASTGFNPVTGENDNGTNMFQLYAYRKNNGIIDAAGTRHRIQAFLECREDKDILAAATYMFGTVGIGIKVYDWAEKQFANHQPWDVQRGGVFKGGHAIPVVGRKANGNFLVVTWGELQEMTPEFYEKMAVSTFVGVTQDYLTGDLSPEGLHSTQLAQDLPKLDWIN